MRTEEKVYILEIKKENATTFFEHKEISVPGDYSEVGFGLGMYRFLVNNETIDSAPNEYIKKALDDINKRPEACVAEIKGHGFPFIDTMKYDQYLMKFSDYVIKKMEIILWASFINWKNEIGIQPEKLVIKMKLFIDKDNTKHVEKVVDAIAEVVKIEWSYPQNDVFCDIAIKSAYYQGASMIASAEEYFLEKEAIDFYQINETATCTSWKPFDLLNDEEEQLNVIYMLYDSKKGHIYVGRADKLKERLYQHRDKKNYPDDPIPEFTHYRYTKLQDRYYKYSYLIEDAAIHDMAWIYPMGRSSYFHRSLQEEITSGRIEAPKDGIIRMVNRVECQPQIINKSIL